MYPPKKIAAIIAEYNPFHNGHEYHIKKTREMTGADYIVVIMSTNYVQRGEPAILDRFLRAEAALSSGADAVFELPVTVSTGGADIFSLGSVALAENLGIVDYLSFGVETEDLEGLKNCSNLLLDNKDFELSIKKYMAEGLTFPECRERFLRENGHEKEASILASPNNILAISYLNSLSKLNSKIMPLPIKRKTSEHHSLNLSENGNIASARAIREELKKKNQQSTFHYLPKKSLELIMKENNYLENDDFSSILFYKLNSIIHANSKKKAIDLLSSYQDITTDLAGRIYNHFQTPLSFQDFSNFLWGKNYTYTRITRALHHIILNITKDLISENKELHYCPYIRPLAIKKDALGILESIKKKGNTALPLLTRIGDIHKSESLIAKKTFSIHLEANELYKQLSFHHHRVSVYNDRKNSFMLIL